MPVIRPGYAHPCEELREEFDRLWSSFTSAPPVRAWTTGPAPTVFPAVNIAESDEALVIEAELPGLDVGDVDISASDDELVVKGVRKEAWSAVAAGDGNGAGGSGPPVTWHRRERMGGAFERRLALPVAIDASRVEARLADGVLTVTCPKSAQAQPRKVQVQSA